MFKLSLLLFFLTALVCSAAPKKIKVFVALCDNETQGIAPVGKVIGDGDKPDANLYWGCSDGLPKVFGKSKLWKKVSTKKDVSKVVLREVTFQHKKTKSKLTALAYRGSEMKQYFADYEKAVASSEYDFVCFIGHNALMDFEAQDPPAKKPDKHTTAVCVLCCLSDSYFSKRIKKMGAEPVVMTQSLMYPGAFILHDVLEQWFLNKGKAAMRTAAGKAYYKNQKKINKRLTLKGATNVFSKLAE